MKVSFAGTAGFIAAFVFAQAAQSAQSAHAADANPSTPQVSIQEAATLLSGTALQSGLPPALNTEQWTRYSNQVRSNWTQYVTKIANPMMAWSQKEVPAFRETVFYPFSGPDFSTVYQMYPNAQRYVMVAMQRAYQPIDLRTLNASTLDQTLNVLISAWANYGRDGFFVTEYLDQYVYQNRVHIGAGTLLATTLRLQRFVINDVVPVDWNEKGEIIELPATTKEWTSVRFKLTKNGRPVTLDYLRIDLSNKGLEASPKNYTLIKQLASNPTLFKAASHLPQNKTFSMTADAVINNAPFIVQDETGIQYTKLDAAFSTQLYGKFERAHQAFNAYQRDLAKAFEDRKDIRPLNFRMGYYKDGTYAVITATRKK
jgi:hypothetical protein